jgi:hypothetical protein
MEYSAIIWDPYNKNDINKLENLQQRGARFITKDYKSREEGSMTNMVRGLNLPLLQTRRQHQRLIFFYKLVKGQIPAIPPHEYISHQKPKRHIRARTFQDCETTNSVNLQVRNNTRAIVVEHSNTDQYRNSLFIRTAINWNHLENSLVIVKTTEEFKGLLATLNCALSPVVS